MTLARATRDWLAALQSPELSTRWDLARWEHAVRQSRRLRLLGRLAEAVAGAGLLEQVPHPAARHLRAEMQFSRARTTALRWTVERMSALFAGAPYPRVLLKGSAYIAQGLPIAPGRLPSDLDILVPQEHIADAQARLLEGGWEEHTLDDHDQRYYREWSHEVPPMHHPAFALELDLHHNILPPVARTRVDAAALFARLQPSGWAGWQVLQPHDQVLHSAAHLFQDSELRERLRDLVDLDGLMRHHGRDPAFWPGLADRSQALGLAEPLALACHLVSRWLGTPVPQDALARIEAAGSGASGRARLMPLWDAVLTPTEPDDPPSWRQGAAAQLLLLRYHLHRMPLRLLLPHLWHKARRPAPAAEPEPGAPRGG